MSKIYLYKNRMWKVLHEFSYTGEPQPFNINAGEYLFICKGAYGGTRLAGDITMRNRGGTSYGIINLQSSLTAYAVVGGNGTDSSNTDDTEGLGGYNGGGRGGKHAPGTTYYNGGGGGGASDIRLSNDESDVIEEIPNPDFPDVDEQFIEEYQIVTYIKSSAKGAYINTGVNLALGMKIEVDFNYISSAGNEWFTGACTDYSNNGVEAGYYEGRLYTGAGFTYSQSNYLKRFTATALIDTAKKANTVSTLTVFARNERNSPNGFCHGYCYGIRIWQNDVMIHNFVPCYRKADNVVGMYDIIGDAFFVNKGSQFFVAGDIMTPTIIKNFGTKTLLSRIIVAGGGGGSQNIYSNYQPHFTGYGGGVNGGYPAGGNGVENVGLYPTQTTGYSFGIGQDAPAKTNNRSWGAEGAGGGGGGWFGGYAITSTNAENSSGNGGGGSGYVLTNSSYRPEHYLDGVTRRDLEFTDVFMSAGSAEESCVMICEPTEIYDDNDEIICDCIGEGTSFPLYIGQYTVKCYGGFGATRYYQSQISRGGFAQGTFNNKEYTTAYAHVGGSGTYGTTGRGQAYISATHPTLSYNGGGIISDGDLSSTVRGAVSAGGGTDLRIGTDSLYARIIVAGGGGGSGCNDHYGGDGGGTSGGERRNARYGTNYGPGTQTAAGAGSEVTISGGFGYGGAGYYRSDGYGGAGGGGWFGGSGTYPDNYTDNDDGGSGGSGYVLTESSFKPENYLLDESYYMTDTQLSTGGNTLPYAITKLTILCNSVSLTYLLCHDEEGYKYFDQSLHKWVFLQTSEPTLEDFLAHPTYSFISDDGLLDSFRILFYDRLNKFDILEMNVLPIKQTIKTRYYTELTMTRSSIDADVDPSCVQFSVFATRKGVGIYAYIEFVIECNITDIPSKETRMYCLQGYTQGSAVEYHEPQEKVYLEHIDLLPVGTGNRIPWRFKNYIGTEVSGVAISTINSAVCCEHDRCIYSATLCNNAMVRFAKLNLITNESTILKDIPKNQIGNTYYGDIKVDDNYIYLTSSLNNNARTIWVTPNSSDTTVNSYTPGNSDNYNFNAVGKMYWLDNHTIAILYRKGVFLFDTNKRIFINNASNYQNDARRDFVLGKRYALSTYAGNSANAYVWEIATNTWTRLTEDHGQSWAGSYLNCGCYNDGTFYVTQRNRLHFLDEETMTITKSIPTPYTTIDPKTIEYSNGYLYITIQNSNVIYIYDIANDRFSSTGIPFKIDNWASDGWLRPCSFRGYFFIPQIKLYVTNFTSYAKYNMGYKYDQFIMITNKEHELEQGYEYDDRFVTFTEDNMWIHDGYLTYEMTEIDPHNHIKCVDVDKTDYNKIISSRLSTSESNKEGGEDIGN